MEYIVNSGFKIYCGFEVTGIHISNAVAQTNTILSDLPSTLYRIIDYKTTSAMIGAIFCDTLAGFIDGIVNPIEKGHPDILPPEAQGCSEEQLRNYPEGLEVKCTIGNIVKGANLRAGETRINNLTGITWQAHHREVKALLGLVWDFVDNEQAFNYPALTAAFYTDDLTANDWGEISGTTGRNTKVTGMLKGGKRKMGEGWVTMLRRPEYASRYTELLGFKIQMG
ncbi:MAG: hypothetical protein JOZ02_24595 [Acidobacteria bacterium]|nr:hypothetical protein [Acidobacteriota bacterium]